MRVIAARHRSVILAAPRVSWTFSRAASRNGRSTRVDVSRARGAIGGGGLPVTDEARAAAGVRHGVKHRRELPDRDDQHRVRDAQRAPTGETDHWHRGARAPAAPPVPQPLGLMTDDGQMPGVKAARLGLDREGRHR
jgi:hypothetical protein